MLRLEIVGKWEPEDFIEVLKGIESLYYKVALRRHFPFDYPHYWFERPDFVPSFEQHLDFSNDWLLSRARTISRPHTRLTVSRIEYASPGSLDLAGLGEACKAVEGIVDRLIKFFTERELRHERDKQARIETAMKEVELEQEEESLRGLKIENARALLDLRRDYPEMPDDILMALIVHDQDRLVPRIAERKITAVKTIDGQPPEDDKAE